MGCLAASRGQFEDLVVFMTWRVPLERRADLGSGGKTRLNKV